MESFLASQKRRLSGAPSKRELLALGALIGIAFFLIVYGTASLDVSYDSWILSGTSSPTSRAITRAGCTTATRRGRGRSA